MTIEQFGITIVRERPEEEDSAYGLYVSTKECAWKNLALIDDPENPYARALKADNSALLVALEALSGWLKTLRLTIVGEWNYPDAVFQLYELVTESSTGDMQWLSNSEVGQLVKLLALRVKFDHAP